VTPLTVDLFSDVICPWCLIGARRLDEALPPDATVRYHPFLLDPTIPPEGVNLADRLRRKYGGDPRKMQERVEAVARASGIPLDLRRVERTYPTVAAQTLIRRAGERGTQRAVASALFDAYFFDARNIGDPDVLVELATRHGFDAAEARRIVTDETELSTTSRRASTASKPWRVASSASTSGSPMFRAPPKYASKSADATARWLPRSPASRISVCAATVG
jgi:predicted DsbA family dithiol-disulfide isomerase